MGCRGGSGGEGKTERKTKRSRISTGRKYVFCPIPGCASPPLKKMFQHLRQYHHLNDADVHKYLKKKKCATMEDLANGTRRSSTSDSGCQDIRTFWGGTGENRDGEGTATNIKGSVGQTKKGKERMGSAVEGYVEVESGESGPRITKRASTRGMETHPIEEYDGFLQYLLTLEGGKKSEKNASGIVANVAKYHYYASPEEFNPKISLKAKSVRAFVSHLESTGIGPSGLIQSP